MQLLRPGLPGLESFLRIGCQPVSDQLRLDEANLPDYLAKLDLLPPGEELRVEPAGEGNINWVRRVRAPRSGRSLVVKQARPALERFPEYRASTERIVFEARYYETVRPLDREGICPQVLWFDAAQRVLVLEDLGAAERLDAALARGADVGPVVRALGAFLGAVHAATGADAGRPLAGRFANDEMRRLHGDHIFQLPYRANDFPLSEALRDTARAIWRDGRLRARIDAAYTRYLEPEGALLHADVQPTNVLLAPGGPKLLDAEIAHVGDPAFDVGVLVGHLVLWGVAGSGAAQARAAVERTWSAYAEAHGPRELTPFEAVALYAGIEVLRRTIGAARVAAIENDRAALAAVEAGLRLVAAPPSSPAALIPA